MKSCWEDHLIDRANSIRLGTLEAFRKNSDPEIGDQLEGALQTRLKITQPQLYKNSDLNQVFAGAMAFGETPMGGYFRRPFRMNIQKLEIGKVGKHNTEISSAKSDYVTQGSDALIFCMTNVNFPPTKPRLGYDHFWIMKRSSASRFGEKLLRHLNEALRDNPADFLTQSQIKDFGLLSDLRFELKFGPVRYRSRDESLADPSNEELGQLSKLLRNSDMVKAINYIDQDEFRFCFRLMNGKAVQKFKPGLEHVDVPADDFRRFQI